MPIETKWTPGPWVVHEGGNYVWVGAPGYLEYVDQERYLGGPFGIAELNEKQSATHEHTHHQALANARLIASAPELYEALRMYVERGHHDTCQHALCNEYECNCGCRLGAFALANARGGK